LFKLEIKKLKYYLCFILLVFVLGKPSLVRETSRFSLLDTVRHPILSLKELKTKKSSALKDVILPPALESRLGYIQYYV